MRAGVDLKNAMALTGHKDPSVFRRYQQINAEDAINSARKLEEYRRGLGHGTGTAENHPKSPAHK